VAPERKEQLINRRREKMNHEEVLHACALTLPPAMYSTLLLLANSSYLAEHRNTGHHLHI
jgi:hypothetical protein